MATHGQYLNLPSSKLHVLSSTRQTGHALRSVVFFASTCTFYLLLLLWNTFHPYNHIEKVLLAWQYMAILPALLLVLRRSMTSDSSPASLPRMNPLLLIAVFAICTAAVGWYSATALFNPDESGYNFQARIFAAGKLTTAPLPGAAESPQNTPQELRFQNHVLTSKAWFVKFPPGWPALLAVGYLLHARWLVNPLLAAALLGITYLIGRRHFSRTTAGIAVAIAVLSPFCFVNSFDMMSHTFCALLTAAACLFLFRGLQKRSLAAFAGMFLMLTLSFQVRPFTAFLFAVVFTCAALWYLRRDRRFALKVLAVGCLFGALTLLSVGTYNKFYTGRFRKSPYAMSVGADAPQELSWKPREIVSGLAKFGRRSFQDSVLYIFPFAFLLVIYTLAKETNARREVTILAAAYLAIVAGYTLHAHGSGVLYGERFHYEAFFALCLLAARGLDLLAQQWPVRRSAWTAAILALAVLQVVHEGSVAHETSLREQPYRIIKAAAAGLPQSSVVFLENGPEFVAKHFNLNEVNWKSAAHVFVVDAEPAKRAEWTCRIGRTDWDMLGYDSRAHQLVHQHEHDNCGSADAKP